MSPFYASKLMKILPANSEGCWIFIFVIFLSFDLSFFCHSCFVVSFFSHFSVIFLSFFDIFWSFCLSFCCYFFGMCLSFSWHFLIFLCFLALSFTCFVVFLHQSNLVAVVQFMFFLRPCLNSFVFGLAACTVAFFQFS